MQRMPHGYTNRTVTDARVVVKSYEGPDAEDRFERERLMLSRLRGRLPVPPLISSQGGSLTMTHVDGVHGQELLDAGHARDVLRTCGVMLKRLHALVVEDVAGRPRPAPDNGTVLVHGDYGPQNVLINPATWEVTAVLDWEWSGWGQPVDDLAWCEWIIRMHHPEHLPLLGEFFDAYGGEIPPWPVRQAVMVERCRSLRDFCDRWEPAGPGVTQWEDRAATTARWSERS